MKLIEEEINRINNILGVNTKIQIVESEQDNRTEYYIKRIIDILKFSDVYSAQVQKDLNKIVEFSKEQIIDFSLLERGVIKVLKLKEIGRAHV